jgi:hypothetical protein
MKKLKGFVTVISGTIAILAGLAAIIFFITGKNLPDIIAEPPSQSSTSPEAQQIPDSGSPEDLFSTTIPTEATEIDFNVISDVLGVIANIAAIVYVTMIKNPFNFMKKKPTIGTILYKGNVYCGELVDGIPSGKGTLLFHNGLYYEGDFVKGERTGKGKLIESDDRWAEVELNNGNPVGVVTIHNPDGTIWNNL